jgi:hypothetical protein
VTIVFGRSAFDASDHNQVRHARAPVPGIHVFCAFKTRMAATTTKPGREEREAGDRLTRLKKIALNMKLSLFI